VPAEKITSSVEYIEIEAEKVLKEARIKAAKILRKGDEVKLTVFLNTSISTSPGNYTGEIDIITEKSKIPFLGNVLRGMR